MAFPSVGRYLRSLDHLGGDRLSYPFLEDMIAVLGFILVPCALWYGLLFAIGWILDRDLNAD